MMIGTPTASSLWPAYLLTVFSVVAGFAVYDILYRRVPDRALAFFMPFAALAPLLKVCLAGDGGQLWPTVAEALAGALLGFCIPLAAAMATGGTGLGLAIVKHVLTRHHATLEIESEAGKGSRFLARFPSVSLLPG